MGFEEWKAKQEQMHNDYDAENAWNAGVASRQAEINSINQDLNHAFATVETQCKQIDELQKRIDDSIALLQGKSIGEVYKAIRILKGGKND